MPLSKAKKESDKRHLAKLDQIKIQPYKEEGQRIRQAAQRAGQPLQQYILQSVRERMERESE